MTHDERTTRGPREARVVVVGPCASGKSTLVANLKRSGVDAWVAGQEHSDVRFLWARREPDLVVALDLDLATLRERRGPTWPDTLYATQHRRLQDAFAHADILLDTGLLSEAEVLREVLNLIGRFERASSAQTGPPDEEADTPPPHPW